MPHESGIDGVLVVDLPYEEAKELRIYTDAVVSISFSYCSDTGSEEVLN